MTIHRFLIVVKVRELLQELEPKAKVMTINGTGKRTFDIKTGSHTTEVDTTVS